jgi:hypothetical protein
MGSSVATIEQDSGIAKSSKPVLVTLTVKQREQLESLWFYYSHYGPHTLTGNHNFIQHLLKNGYDEQSPFTIKEHPGRKD